MLELCSGKGGDLKNWIQKSHTPSHYVAFEYSKASTNIAIQRLEERTDVDFPAIFITGDVGDEKNTIDKILKLE